MSGNTSMISYCEQNRCWKKVEIDNKVHMICLTKEEESWKVFLTDLIDIWIETLTHKTIFRKCKTLNPLLNLEAFDWKQLVMDMLNNIPEYIVEASVCQIKLQKDKDFIKLKFSLDFLKGTAEQFWENITMPLWLSSMELMRQHKILLDLVKQKDEEITEYKDIGAKLMRPYIATKPFSEELLQTDTTSPNAIDFVKTFQSMLCFYDAINLPKPHVKIEPEVSSNSASDNNVLNTDVQNMHLDKNMHNQSHSKKKEGEYEVNPSTSKTSILGLSNTSFTIQKSLKKSKKSLNIL